VRPGASVHVDWVLKGTEIGFRYGELGDDIWALLFQTLRRLRIFGQRDKLKADRSKGA
jgi:hypothetical protein